MPEYDLGYETCRPFRIAEKRQRQRRRHQPSPSLTPPSSSISLPIPNRKRKRDGYKEEANQNKEEDANGSPGGQKRGRSTNTRHNVAGFKEHATRDLGTMEKMADRPQRRPCTRSSDGRSFVSLHMSKKNILLLESGGQATRDEISQAEWSAAWGRPDEDLI